MGTYLLYPPVALEAKKSRGTEEMIFVEIDSVGLILCMFVCKTRMDDALTPWSNLFFLVGMIGWKSRWSIRRISFTRKSFWLRMGKKWAAIRVSPRISLGAYRVAMQPIKVLGVVCTPLLLIMKCTTPAPPSAP